MFHVELQKERNIYLIKKKCLFIGLLFNNRTSDFICLILIYFFQAPDYASKMINFVPKTPDFESKMITFATIFCLKKKTI